MPSLDIRVYSQKLERDLDTVWVSRTREGSEERNMFGVQHVGNYHVRYHLLDQGSPVIDQVYDLTTSVGHESHARNHNYEAALREAWNQVMSYLTVGAAVSQERVQTVRIIDEVCKPPKVTIIGQTDPKASLSLVATSHPSELQFLVLTERGLVDPQQKVRIQMMRERPVTR